ncbi:two-component response regulator ARR1-like [Solanum tuberosum]|uniref:two-component response regulator ARR1-like n=1 Tax=Solanum tuberosum TaxID=4113 RepID=UPI00073A32C4|nr:PREDICTED: two-component response regulator ARR1-like [Solanum tuberosum]
MASTCYAMTEGLHVMLVDHDEENAAEMVDLLEFYGYKVTIVGTYSEAVSMLFKGKKNIDMIIISVHSPNLDSFKLLAQAVTLDKILLFVSDEYNDLLAKKALKEGAYLFVKRPLNEEIVKHLWQFILTKRIQKDEVRKESEDEYQMNVDDIDKDNFVGDNEKLSGEKNNVSDIEEQSDNIHEAENNIVSNGECKLRRKSRRKNSKETNEGESQNTTINKVVRRKNCTKWTANLHAKFMKSLELLGEGSCYPKQIVEVMNVPGLTRMQVASHLQKCRSDNWRSPEERKYNRRPSSNTSLSDSQQKNSFRKFGTMPHFQKNISQRNSELTFPTLHTNSTFVSGESSTQEPLYPPQFHVQPHHLNIGNSFNNSFSSISYNVGGVIQQQRGVSFETLDSSQQLQGSIIGSTNYRSDLTLNNGDRHTQNDYNLNLNVPHGTTYPGNIMLFDIDIESATCNKLKVTNANFQ